MSALIGTMLVAFVLRIDDDLRARRRNLEQLAFALLKAETADRAKTEFLANASHELRTPLTAILGFSEIMSSQMFGPLPAKYEAYARDIHKTATHLFAIIRDILDLTVIDLGGLQVAETNIDVAALVGDCTHMTLASRSGNDKVRIKTEIAPALPMLRADARMVKQMVINLLSNAIKYSPKGGEVVVRVEMDPNNGGLNIAVIDSGRGIAEADISYVMQPFGRLNSAKLAQAPGIGIGLPLTKSMIELQGGKLILKSKVGVGTEVCLWFPPSRIGAAAEEAS